MPGIRRIIIGLSLILIHSAQADLNNPNVLPIGESEALMGNSGVAGRNSAGGPYYNPAGLAGFVNHRISASGATYALVEATLSQEGNPLQFKEFNTVPSMLVAARKSGAWTGAFSIFVPVVLEINTLYDTSFPSLNIAATLSLYNRAEENYIGLSAGRSITQTWDWGVGVHLHRTRITKNETVQGVPTGAGTLYLAQSKRLKSEVLNLVLSTGVQKQIHPDVRFGLSLQSETLKLQGQAERYDQKLIVSAGTPTTTAERQKHKANAKIPWQLLTGLEWKLTGRLQWQFDFGLSFAASNSSVPGSPDNEVVHTRATGRAGSGISYRVTDRWKVLAGVSYNPSTVEYVESAQASSGMRNNFLGFTAGLLNEDDKVSTGLGLFYLKSRTDRQFFGPAASDPTSLSVAGVILTTSLAY